jgi:hypothetical protein
MKPIMRFPAIDRRSLVVSLSMLPALSASFGPVSTLAQAQSDPLPSWNDGATKASILDFVARVTAQGGPYFVPPEQVYRARFGGGTRLQIEADLRRGASVE